MKRKYFNNIEELNTKKYDFTKCCGYVSTNHKNNSIVIEIPFGDLEHFEKYNK